tara:strand:+ start:498 stop:1175 length:678 start_codon:yes stop_codon:yes gene_type:complete
MNDCIKAINLTKLYTVGEQTVQAVSNVNISVNSGEFVSIYGRSGSGKTTLLNLLAGLEIPSEGLVKINDLNLNEMNDKQISSLRKKEIGFVFQTFSLLPLLTAYENVELPLRILEMDEKTRKEKTLDALMAVDIDKRSSHRPYELSGGEQQRVSIARAIVHNPSIIFADEPTAELDSKNANNVFEMFRKFANETDTAIICSTHDTSLLNTTDRVVQLKDGQVTED